MYPIRNNTMSNFELNDKKIQILEVAEKLFSEKGFEGTSIRDISKEAKINIAMVSYYFGSKERLLEALIFHKTVDLKLQLENLLQESIEPLEKVNKLIEIYINRICLNKGIYRVLHFELYNKKREKSLQAFTELKKGNLKSVESIIRQGQSQGVFRTDINIQLITPTIIGTFFHFHMNRSFFEEIFDLKTEEMFNNYIKNDLTKHIQQTIKALLVYEN
ncbi:transcriptional regulator, TetR family [Flavobacterium chilense]|uniref:Transcriptional regulator, TetR family n=2 Tax=Flavobacterium chilense TaxID=946677 RepID=A0A1M7JWL4_9FLAO|nr:transcriptional regulator, TetR family [Flavobacterium chilense]